MAKTLKQDSTNQEILRRSIQKAIDNGWSAEWSSKTEITVYNLLLADISDDGLEVNLDAQYHLYNIKQPRSFIFNHDFAKALWGENRSHYKYGNPVDIKDAGWELHLQQMVISPDPIKYLGDYLND